jgi:hydrogenase nickel incorporation protein HypA/HybF
MAVVSDDMHELGITQNMFDLVLEEAEKAGARKVCQVDLVIGELTGAVGESIQFYFDILSRGTIVEGALISIKVVPPMVLCRNCNQTSKIPKEEFWKCPHCTEGSMEIIAGRELMVKSIEVELDGDNRPQRHSERQ